jgi:hypothetical protein
MLGKGILAAAIALASVGAVSAPAHAQSIVGGVYVSVPPAYVEIGPPPGRGYIWVPGHRRWELRRDFDRRYYERRDFGRRDFDRRDFDRRDFDRHHDRDFGRNRGRDGGRHYR